MIFSNLKKQNGQGLLELVVAIGVISVGLFSVWNLFISNYNGEQEAGARILSINLAREGIEIVKNVRDSNWLAIDNNDNCSFNGAIDSPCKWDSGLSGDGTAVLKNILLENVYLDYSADNISDSNTKIYLDSLTNIYSHDPSGEQTTYHRLIKLQNICCSDSDNDLQCDNFAVDFVVKPTSCLSTELKAGIDVEAIVSWSLNNKPRQLSVNERIFNWK